MSSVEVRIAEFPIDDKYWRIDGLGYLIYPAGSTQSEPLVTVHLTELHSSFEDPLSNRSVIRGNGRVISIKIGQIAFINKGEVWHNQVWVPHRKPPRELSVTLSGHQLELCRLGDRISTDHEDVHLLYDKFSMSSHSASALGTSWAVITQHPSQNIEFIVIPSTVLFQKCLATSPAAIRHIAWGQIDRIVNGLRYVPSTDGRRTLYVEVEKDIRSAEAFVHASLLVDPLGKREFLRFRKNLTTASANSNPPINTAHPHHIKFGLPFKNPTTLHTQGKFIPLQSLPNKPKRWGFLVTNISSMELNLVFERLIVHRKYDGSQGENADDPNLEESAWAVPPRVTTPPMDEVPLHSGHDPHTDLKPIDIAAVGGIVAAGLELVIDPKITQKYRRKIISGNAANNDGAATTGKPGNNGGSAAADIESQEVPPQPVTLGHFFETLELLRDNGYPFKTLTTTRSVRFTESGDSINFLPSEIPPLRSWHLTSDRYGAPPRGYIVAMIQQGGIFHYLIELERKNTEAHSLAYVRSIAGEEIDARRFHFFMIEVARENGWNASSQQPNWKLERIRHSPSRGIAPFAIAIIKELKLK
jgi:hypothetical protein